MQLPELNAWLPSPEVRPGRLATAIPVIVQIAGEKLSGIVSNVSTGGLRITGIGRQPEGVPVKVAAGTFLMMYGEVRWSDAQHCGVQLTDVRWVAELVDSRLGPRHATASVLQAA
ncbi:MAG: PilZ domain-containing protein [Hyphomicrobium sp.]